MRQPTREQQFFDRMAAADAEQERVRKLRERLRRISELARMAHRQLLNLPAVDELREHAAAIRFNAQALLDDIDDVPL